MPAFICEQGTEITGHTVLALITNIQHQEIEPILQHYQLDNIDPTEWYPLQDVLDVLHEISGNSDSMSNLVSIGLAAGELGAANLPPTLAGKTFEEIIMLYPEVLKTRFRPSMTGDISVEKLAENHLMFTIVDDAFPDDIYYGVFYGYARALLPPKTYFTVKYDDQFQRAQTGGNTTCIHINW